MDRYHQEKAQLHQQKLGQSQETNYWQDTKEDLYEADFFEFVLIPLE